MGLKPREDTGAHGRSVSSGYASDQPSPSYEFDEVSTCLQVGSRRSRPSNATATTVAASAENGRIREMRYIKLPWTHDETELASGHGGFAQGVH